MIPRILLLCATLALSGCSLFTPHRPPQQVTRTTTAMHAGFGASPVTVTVETPYESPAYTAAGEALFSRP